MDVFLDFLDSLDFYSFIMVTILGGLANLITVYTFANSILKGGVLKDINNFFTLIAIFILSLFFLASMVFFVQHIFFIKLTLYIMGNIYIIGSVVFFSLSYLMMLYGKSSLGDIILYSIVNITLIVFGFIFILMVDETFVIAATIMGASLCLAILSLVYTVPTKSTKLPDKYFSLFNNWIDNIGNENEEHAEQNWLKNIKGYKSRWYICGYVFFQTTISIILYWYQFDFMNGSN